MDLALPRGHARRAQRHRRNSSVQKPARDRAEVLFDDRGGCCVLRASGESSVRRWAVHNSRDSDSDNRHHVRDALNRRPWNTHSHDPNSIVGTPRNSSDLELHAASEARGRTVSDADIIARVRLYESSKGGRMGPTPADRFGCVLVVGGSAFDCRLVLSGVGALHPGQSATVPIKLLNPELARDVLSTGRRFLLRDGGVVGEGEVKAVVGD